MKTILLLPLFLLILKVGNSQTNIYHPFPDSAAVWNLNYYNYCFGPTTQENYSITISGDTLINSQTYHKLNIAYVQVITSTCGLNTTIGYKGAIRQDTAARKVFFIPPADSSEQLLYDFNLQIGDTVVGYFINTYSGYPETVQSMDSVLVGGNYHKRWQINPLYQVEFIEGVGSTYGLIAQLPGGNISDLPHREITCFSQNDITVYPSTATTCDPILPPGFSIENESSQITLFPNPLSAAQVTIQTAIVLDEATVTVHNSLGQEVKQINHISGQTITLFFDNLPGGFYHIRLVQNGKVIGTEKLIIPD